MKIRDLTHTEWTHAMREENETLLRNTWFDFDRHVPTLHNAPPADLLPYTQPEARILYLLLLTNGVPQAKAQEIAHHAILAAIEPLISQEITTGTGGENAEN